MDNEKKIAESEENADLEGAEPVGMSEEPCAPLDGEAEGVESVSSDGAEDAAEASEEGEGGKPEKKGGAFGDIFDVLELFVFCTAVILLAFTFLARITVVNGSSMNNTLYHGDALIVSDLFYTPERGDIVVVQNASLEELYGEPLVKRVIATENQTVVIDTYNWTVTVDGAEISEPYIYIDPVYTKRGTYTYRVPEGHIFVMGDNRHHSADSRSSDIGTVDARCVVGKVYTRVLPLEAFGDPDSGYRMD